MRAASHRRAAPALLAALGTLLLLAAAAPPARAAFTDLYTVRAGTAVGLSVDGALFETSGEALTASGMLGSRPAAGTAPFALAAGPGVARSILSGTWTNPLLLTFSFAPQTTATARTVLTVTGPAGPLTTSLNLRVGGTVRFDCPGTIHCQTSVAVEVTVPGRVFRTQTGVNVTSRNDLGLAITETASGFELAGTVTTAPFPVQANTPFEVTLSLRFAVGLGGTGIQDSASWEHDFATGGLGVSFAPAGPVLNVPAGYDVSGASVVGNRWRDPFDTIPVDLVAPVVTGVPVREPNVAGWYREPVRIDWQAVDPEPSSGAPTDPPDTLAAVEGRVDYVSDSSCDPAGNCAVGALTLALDLTPPTVTCPSPAPVYTVSLAAIPLLDATVSDGLSGVVFERSSALTDVSTVGAKTVVLTGEDVAGNVTEQTCAYRVEYAFDGFGAPVESAPALNIVTAGQTVALKWRLTDASGAPVTDLDAATLSAVTLPCELGTTDDLPEEALAGRSGLQDLGDGNYQLNWRTPLGYAGSCKTLQLDLGEGKPRTASFAFRQ